MKHLTGAGLGQLRFQFSDAKILLARIYPRHSQRNASDVFSSCFFSFILPTFSLHKISCMTLGTYILLRLKVVITTIYMFIAAVVN